MLNKIYTFIFLSFVSVSTIFADIQTDIIPDDDPIVANVNWEEGITGILTYIKDTIFVLLMIISVWAFLYVGFKLIIAKWNPEEFKKALMSFVYAIVGIALVSLAYVLVQFISGLQF